MTSSSETIQNELARIIRARYAAFKNDDIETLESHLHDNATVWDVFQPQLFRGRAERLAFRESDHEQMRARGALTLNIDEPVVDIFGETAIARYYLTFSYTPPNPISGHVRVTDVFRRIDGEWTIMHHHEGFVPAGIPPIAE